MRNLHAALQELQDDKVIRNSKRDKVYELIGELNLFTKIEYENIYYCSWELTVDIILLYELDDEIFTWQKLHKGEHGTHFLKISFEEVFEMIPADIQTKLLFHLDLFS